MPSPLLLSKGGLLIKILPHIGATIVSLERGSSGNLFKSDSLLWNGSGKPAITAFSEYKPYYGHTIWVGPQQDWWTQQDLNTERRDTAANWPPDPYLVYGEYQVAHTTDSTISLISPESPITGVQIKKDVAINNDESVYLNTTITNILKKPISWDIWYNTRVEGYNSVFVPVLNSEMVRVAPVLSDTSQEMPYQIQEGFFTYKPIAPEKKFKERSSKSYIYPEKPWIAYFSHKTLFVIRFEHHAQQDIHPQQALVEIYSHTEHDKAKALLELEYHSPYKELNPNESMSAWEVWKLYDYAGEDTDVAKIAFLKALEQKGEL